MKRFLFAFAVLVFSASGASAGDAPPFIQNTYPETAVKPGFQEHVEIMKDGALSGKTKQLIALAVAAQIPCDYCVAAHTNNAKEAGATMAEIKEAVAAAAMVRKWSTVLNGHAYNMEAFKKELGIPQKSMPQ